MVINMRMNATLYYRNKLDENDRAIYDALVNKWMCFENNIKIGIPHSDITTISQAIHFDYPLLFYINYYRITYTQSIFGIYVHGDYLYEKEEAKELLKHCEKWGTYIANHKPHDIGEAELALWLHDVIINNVTYGDGNGIRSHNMTGVVCDSIAVCEGIAMAYKFLCDLTGIPCIYISGMLNEEPHGWNMVWINNKPAFVDVTNDINVQGGFNRKKILRSSFLRSSKEMPGYSWDNSIIPECHLSNKSDQYMVAHDKQEFRQLLTTIGDSGSLNIHLNFGYKLGERDIERLMKFSNFSNPWLMTYKISYSVDRQMVFIQK